nr:AMP-binding protein [Xanthomonas translucens]
MLSPRLFPCIPVRCGLACCAPLPPRRCWPRRRRRAGFLDRAGRQGRLLVPCLGQPERSRWRGDRAQHRVDRRSPVLAAAGVENSYGTTEATCSTIWMEIDAALRAAAPNPFPIGVAKPYAEVFLDAGEICMAGDHVMRGYLDRPGLDQSVLFEHHGKRAYRSGDLGDMDAQGRLCFRDRRDEQIKLNGDRIELAQVDAALSTLDGVIAGAAVVLRRPDGSLVRMIGFVELAAAGAGAVQPLPDALQDWKQQLGRRVPAYMIPSELIAVDALPTGHSDKVDRKRLEQRYAMARTLRSRETP